MFELCWIQGGGSLGNSGYLCAIWGAVELYFEGFHWWRECCWKTGLGCLNLWSDYLKYRGMDISSILVL